MRTCPFCKINTECLQEHIWKTCRKFCKSGPAWKAFYAKIDRLKLARAECGKLLALMRRTPVASAVSVAVVERRLGYLSLAIRMMRETGQIETGLPSVDEIRAEVLDEFNSGQYGDAQQRSKAELNASWLAKWDAS